MNDKLSHILKRVNSVSFARLWMFYRSSFASDEECLDFLHYVLKDTPAELEYYREHGKLLSEVDEDGYNKNLIPRKMLFSVERLVSVARNMDDVRRGQDIFKIVYLVSCVESLQKLRGKDCHKREMLFDFFETFTSDEDKDYITEHFSRGCRGLYPKDNAFWQFVNALSAHRNAAVHEGAYHDFFFNNDDEEYPLTISVEFDHITPEFLKILVRAEGLEEKSEEYKIFVEKKKKDPTILYETTLSYREFEKIFIRTSIEFIRQYVSAQEEKTDADA